MRRGARSAGVGVALVVAALVGLWAITRVGSEPSGAASATGARERGRPVGADRDGSARADEVATGRETGVAAGAPAPTQGRSALGGAGLRVVDEARVGLEGAKVWGVLAARPAGRRFATGEPVQAPPGLAGPWTADAGGRVELDPTWMEDGPEDGWLWAAAPGHRARALAPEDPAGGVQTIALPAAPLRRVRVVDADGHPVAGARVFQQRLVPLAPPYFEAVESDAAGTATLGAVEGRMRLWAQAGERATRAWVGADPEDVELRLQETFLVRGALVAEHGVTLDGGACQVVVLEQRGAVRDVLAAVEPVGAEFGPVPVPYAPGATFEVVVEGEGLASATARLAPLAGERAGRVTLHVRPGAAFLARVSTAAGEPIRGATATVTWEGDGGRAELQLEADAEGVFRSTQVAAGPVRVWFQAPGYCSEQTYDVLVPNAEELWVGLRPSAPLEGLVLGPDGEPAADYDVLAWTPGNRNTLVQHEVRGARDGRFVFEDAPTGEVFVLATGAVHPTSQVERVVAGSEAGRSLRFELERAAAYRLTVVDAANQAPLSDAEVVLHLPSPDGPVRAWGPRERTRADGGLGAAGPSRSPLVLAIEADGYEALVHQAAPAPRPPTELGRIALRKALDLTLRVVERAGDRSGPPNSADWLVWLEQGGVETPYETLGTDGEHVFDRVVPGLVTVLLWRTDEARKQARELVLTAAGERELELVVEGDRALGVRLLEADGSPYLGRAFVLVSYELDGGVAWWEHPVEKGHVARATGLARERVLVRVYSEHYDLLARQWATLTGADGVVEVRLGGRESVLHVEADDGSPVAGATVFLVPAAGGDFFHRDRTDEAGQVTLLGLGGDRFHVAVRAADGTRHDGLEVDFAGEDEARLRLGPSGTLRVRCLDDGEPVAAAEVVLVDVVDAPSRPVRCGPDGTAVIERVGAGRLRLAIGGDGVWARELDAAFTPGDPPVEVRVQRTGDLVLTAVGEAGQPLGGAEVRLEWREDGATVAAWIDVGRIEGTTPLTTGVDGRLSLAGLPRGIYAWAATTAAAAGSGTVEVAPGSESTARLVLAPR